MAGDVSWRVYYDDGATFDAAPEVAPAVGVICVVQPDPDHGRMVLSKWDYYCWHPDTGQWWGHDIFGLFDCLVRPGWKRVLFGRTVPTGVFRAVVARAECDADFPRRSAATPRELAVTA